MRVHTMRELGAGQCTPHSKRRRDLQQAEASASFGKNNSTVLRKMNFSRENQTKAGYSVCFAHLFLPAWRKISNDSFFEF